MTELVIPPQVCHVCWKPSGTHIVCNGCFPTLTKTQVQRLDGVFQRAIIELFGNQCVDCGKSAETDSGELCGDHLNQKNTDPLARYDLANAVCRCMEHHTKRHTGEVKRVPAKEKLPQQTKEKAAKHTKSTCKIARCNMIPAVNGLCIFHMKRR